jgi:L-glyceraldehyde 3-phosphate reductase
VTHFDLANNYGPPYGAAESNFGRILREDFASARDELVISTKAGWDMWPGPYGEFGSRKYLLASLDQSLQRMGLDYVDVFYSHRFDPDTPLEETMGALDSAVRQGKALYAGISSYSPQRTREAARILRDLGTPAAHPPAVVLHAQPLDRAGAARRARRRGRRLHRVLAAGPGPADRPVPRWRARGLPRSAGEVARPVHALGETLRHVRALAELASERGQSLAQTALAWALRDERVTSVLIGASSVRQLEQNIASLDNVVFTDDELRRIDEHAVESGVNLWAGPSSA